MRLKITTLAVLLLAAVVPAARAAGPLPKHGDFIAMGGDSITYMSRYSLYVETYLLATRPDLDLRVMKIQRWCGGTADNYAAETLDQELIPAKPNIFTVCFGMNDGGGGEFNSETEHRYEAALTQIVERNQANGTVTVVCSPGVVDTFSYENPEFAQRLLKAAGDTSVDPMPTGERIAAIAYNRTLGSLGDAGRRVAAKHGVPFADIHSAMFDVLQAGVAGYGKSWPPRTSLRRPDRRALICDDGIHPDTAAHIPMAYAVLKAMGFDGDIGSIDFDWANGSVRTDVAQTAAVTSKGRLELESTRLPMCFFDDTACSEGYPSVPVRYVLQHCPFNPDLNRYVLRVSGLPNQPVRVRWGDRSLVFTREQLQAGINLAAEFPETPFCPTMHALDRAVWQKQVFERNLFAILNIPIWNKHFEGAKPADRSRMLGESLAEFSKWSAREFPDNPKLLDACENVRTRVLQETASVTPTDLSVIRRTLFERDREYHEKARALVKPVHHVLTIQPLP
jgi:lysophospholipase L1-like esterase